MRHPLARSTCLLLSFQIAAMIETRAEIMTLQSKLIEKCCDVGKAKAMESAKFSCKMSARDALVNLQSGRGVVAATAESVLARDSSFADQCEMILESCCMAYHRTRNCDSGKQYAKSGAACMDVELSREATVATESFNDCCVSCSLGILAARNPGSNETAPTASLTRAQLNNRCRLMSPLASSLHGQLYEDTYGECCAENLPKPAGALLEPGSAIDCVQSNPCSQRCISSSSSVESFSLTDRQGGWLSGGPLNRMRSEHSVDRCDCYSGYQLAADGTSCLDIDECKLQQHTCDLQSQICDNTNGGFRCLSRQSQAAGSTVEGREMIHDPVESGHQMAGGFSSMRLCPLGKRWSPRENKCVQPGDNPVSQHHYSSSSSSFRLARSSAYRSVDG